MASATAPPGVLQRLPMPNVRSGEERGSAQPFNVTYICIMERGYFMLHDEYIHHRDHAGMAAVPEASVAEAWLIHIAGLLLGSEITLSPAL